MKPSAMEETSTTFGKQHGVMISRKSAALIVIVFCCCLIATGLIVYNFTSTCPHSNLKSEVPKPQASDCNITISTENAFITTSQLQISPIETTTVTSEENITKASEEKLDVRLPKSVLPESYEIKITPFLQEDNFTFNGEVNILVNVTDETTNITLHFDDITIDYSSLSLKEYITNPEKNLSTRSIELREINNDTEKQFLIIHTNEPLSIDQQYIIHIEYKGILNDILQGFYRSSYSVDNQTRWIATTQFQPTDARRAFPCFDEPAMKAKFKISICRPVNMSSLSNMPQIGHQADDTIPGYVWDYYQESVPMSTYLVAFAVTDFGNISSGNFSVWARKEALPQANYSLFVGPKILKHYEQYFQIPFPLPKMDMIALPDFSAGAMENWGLITYRETAMLYQEGVSTSLNLQRVATVIAHELAHQWFGNLVTPSWWTDLWLNEGFATYIEYIGANAVEPEWKILDQFVIQQLHYSFALDALETSHQISIEVGHPDEINDIFDRISYAKGASVIRMMDHFLTERVFKEGLKHYLNSRKYSSAEQDDLWEALTLYAHKYNILHSDVTVKQVMDTWTLQTGFPVVTVIRNYSDSTAFLCQQRFLLLGTDNKTHEELWWIPITYTTQKELNFNDTKTKSWLKKVASDVISDIPASENQWIIVNVQETGYYRVNYDDANWKMLSNHLRNPKKFKEIQAINRAQLLDDALNLARAGHIDYSIALNVTRYLVHERDFVPWQAAFVAFSYVDSMFIRTGHYDKFKEYVLNLISGLYNDIGFHDKASDTQLTLYKRIDVLHWACALGYQDCVRNSVTQFQNWRSSPNPDYNNPISPNLKSIVYCTALRVGGQEEWDFAWQRYLNTNVGSEKEILMSAMGCSRETWLLSRYLDWAVTSNSGIRKQDAPRVFAAVASNSIGQELSFNFLRNNWLRIKEYMGSSLSVINSIVRVCTKNRNTVFDVKNLKDFAKDYSNDLGTATRTVNQAIEDAEANVKWMNQNFENIVKWLSNWKIAQ